MIVCAKFLLKSVKYFFLRDGMAHLNRNHIICIIIRIISYRPTIKNILTLQSNYVLTKE